MILIGALTIVRITAVPTAVITTTKLGSTLGSPPRLLFICSRNQWRSLTAEKLFSTHPACQVKSAGTEPSARIRVTEGMVGWADFIFVMEKKHRDFLQMKFPEALGGKTVINLRIPDEFELNDPDLISLLEAGVEPYLDASESF